MSWQESTLALVERFGPGVKFAVETILRANLPHQPAVAELAGHALDCAYQTPKRKLWRFRRGAVLGASEADQNRLGVLFDALASNLPSLMTQLSVLEGDPDGARQALKTALAANARLRSAVAKLRTQARRFDRTGLPTIAIGKLPLAPSYERFTDLPLGEGLCYGCWCLWLLEVTVGLLVANAQTGTFLRIWLQCNGWFEYRTALVAPGKIFTVWSSGSRSLETGRHLDSLDDCGPPRWSLPEGRWSANEWTIEATPTQLILDHPSTQRRLTFERDRPVWDCNDVLWNEPSCKEIRRR